ncbi:MAG: UDP-N-acetylmuramoyl-L-alanyl-D-glutamate--2,6-diaminopimelate ligase [Lysobacter sp.]|nr:MAG: UDP-N-acetylmuramoyl-L-alanyl-D-glutamate--2,6-diaminopimelate ligase [Lysobacter sp.]
MTRSMHLAELLPDVPGIPEALQITGLVQDSRDVAPGNAFVAIGGFGAHGLSFADAARARGASVVLFEPPAPAEHPVPADAIAVPGLRSQLGSMAHRFHGRATDAMRVVGVTGTNGKTSTVQLIAQAQTLAGLTAGSIGTLGAGLYGKLQPTGFTTPLVLRLHALIAAMRDAGAQALAMEVSSHALDQGRVDGVRFDVAVFTNLTRDHLDYHGDMAAYGASKARLFGWPGLGAAVVNLDDDYGRQLFAALPAGVRPIGLSSRGQAGATVQARSLHFDAKGLRFDVGIDGETYAIHSPLLGRFNIDNLLAVAGVLHALGETPAAIAALLPRLQPIHGRMNRLGGTHGQPLVVIDYAHTPDALEQALATLRPHTAGRLVCVFGCGGERDAGKRPQMGAIAARLADVAVVTDDNPRGEDGDAIVAQILAGMPDAGAIVQRDRALAIRNAISAAHDGDVVLIAGKGHESHQDIGGVLHRFDDTETARAALEVCA